MNVSHGQTPGEPSERNLQQPRKKRRSARLIYPAAILLLLLSFMVVPRMASLYDASHHVRIGCTVVEAHGAQVSGSRHGGGPDQRVYITTSECGEWMYETGVTASNRDSVAAEFEPGETYSFEVGQVADKVRWLTNLVGLVSEVRSFEEISG